MDFEQLHPPEICRTIETWGMTCQNLPSNDAMFAKEREVLHQLLIATDTAKYLWAGVHLIMLHLVNPPGFEQSKELVHSYEEANTITEESKKADQIACQMWQKTRAFWYSL